MSEIKLNAAEIQSGLSRVRFAELLILQMDQGHDGRNTWLLNYGISDEAKARRQLRGIKFMDETQSAELCR
jgi:hypothetical protein